MKKYKRTFVDKLISRSNSLRFKLYEPMMLSLQRRQFDSDYANFNETPMVSVYTPTYNRGDILMERALGSVLSQTYTNFEYIIIGDCCTDNTEQLLSKVKDPRVKFYNMPQKSAGYPLTPECRWLAGPVKAANQALGMVRGKWIARLDDDDMFTEDHIERLLEFAQKGNYEFVSGLYEEERFGEKTTVPGIRAQDTYYTGKPPIQEDSSPFIGGTSTWLYRSYLNFIRYNIHCWRKAWNRVNDIDLSLRIFQSRARMGFLEKIVTHVYPRPGEETVGLDAYIEAEKKGMEVHN